MSKLDDLKFIGAPGNGGLHWWDDPHQASEGVVAQGLLV
jgi:hypothetical protein